MPPQGMDTVQLGLLRERLESSLSEAAAALRRADAMLHECYWSGSDAQRVRQQWQEMVAGQLAVLLREISVLAVSLREEIQRQEEASR
ncbi:hypothetical protein KRX56_09000 [Dermabacteraceae bacterium TAE3-ERU27]|nr:hypothetical protein [Dermabacteraceae bacterium TAE3-ERU27]